MITKVKYMIDEIFEEYKNQEKENIILMAKHFDIGVKELLSPNANHDIIVILDSVNLLNEDDDSFRIIGETYEKIVKEGILLGIGFGKTHMIKKIIEFPVNKIEIMSIGLEEYNSYFPKFNETESDFEKISENGMERLIVTMDGKPSDLEIEIATIAHIARIIDSNHKELKKMLFEEFLNDFNINRKKAKYICHKKIKIDSKSLKPLIRSRFFMEKTGKHMVKKIIEDYFDLLIDTGLDIGIRAGLRLVIEDIQKGVMPYEILRQLSETETMMYIQKEHSDYILKKSKKEKSIMTTP